MSTPARLTKFALTALLACNSVLAHADTWPSKPIKFIVPFGPGGANDLVARAVAEATSKQLGQPIIVENKPGAGSVLGADIVAKAAPDGYTFLAPAAGVITNSMIKTKMPYQADDLVPVAMMMTPIHPMSNAKEPKPNQPVVARRLKYSLCALLYR